MISTTYDPVYYQKKYAFDDGMCELLQNEQGENFCFKFSLIQFLLLVNSLFSIFTFNKIHLFLFDCISWVNRYKLYYKYH